MRILYVSPLYPPAIGGAQIQLHCLAKAAQAAGAQVQVLTNSGQNRTDWLRFTTVSAEPAGSYEYEGVPVRRIGFSPMTKLRMAPWAAMYYGAIPLATRALARLHRPYLPELLDGFDVIHFTRIGREFLARACLDYAKEKGIPFVFTPNHHPRWRGWRYVEYDRIYREADALAVYTQAEKDTLVKDIGVDAERIHVTGVGPIVCDTYDVAKFRSESGVGDHKYVLFLGQQYEYKGMAAILKAMPEVWRHFPELRMVFIGPHTPYSTELFKGVSDRRVLNLGAVALDTKAAALAGCEYLCMPSMQESFGGVYVEAWHYGKAAIGGDIPAIRCVIDHGENGLLSTQEPGQLAERMLTLLRDPALCASMGEAGKAKGQREYSWDRIGRKALDIYDVMVSSRARKGGA